MAFSVHNQKNNTDKTVMGKSLMKILSKLEWTMLTLIIVYSLIPSFGGLLRVFELSGGPVIIPENPRALSNPLPIIIHILSSFLFCIAGALQFLPNIRRYQPVMHRKLGRIIVIVGCISAVSGLWMTHYYTFPEHLQGDLLYWVRMVLGSMMLVFIAWAVIAIRSRNVFRHSASMLRAYAIGQGASTQAILGIGWIIVFKTEPLGPVRETMMVFAWGLNLVIAEVLISRLLMPQKRPIKATTQRENSI